MTTSIPALPVIATQLQASPSATSWVLTGFLLSASVATPIVGKLGDVYGRGRMLTTVLAVFALGSAVNALAPSIEVLIAGQVLQGVAGGVFPLAFGVVPHTSPPHVVGSTGLPSEGAYTAAFLFSSVIGLAATGAALLVPAQVERRAAAEIVAG